MQTMSHMCTCYFKICSEHQKNAKTMSKECQKNAKNTKRTSKILEKKFTRSLK